MKSALRDLDAERMTLAAVLASICGQRWSGDESGESSERRWLGDVAGEERSAMRGWWWIKGLKSGV